MSKSYLVIMTYHKPIRGVRTESKNWSQNPDLWTYEEVPEVVSKVSNNKLCSASFVIDLKNNKVVKNRSTNSDEDILAHFKQKYSAYLSHSV